MTTMPSPASPASALAIAGLVPLSTVDWPDHLCATVFLQGCPWRCVYCHNTELIDPRAPGTVAFADVLDLLRRRRGLLDGVVFTGGEATRQAGLSDAIDAVRDLGFAVGLHTAGPYPRRLAMVIDAIDWVGIDIKALTQDYSAVAGFDGGAKAWESLDVVLAEASRRPDFDYEVRTTVHPGSTAVDTFPRILAELRARGVRTFAFQEARPQGTNEEFSRAALSWDLPRWRADFERLSQITREAGFERVVIRSA